jgi:S-adenosyl methyltransferase
VHEVAQATNPEARLASVDNDPMVFLHAEALLKSPGTTVIRADLRDADKVLQAAGNSWTSASCGLA